MTNNTSADEKLITTFMGVDVKKLTSEDIHALSSYTKQRELALLERLEKQAGWYSQQFTKEARDSGIEDTLVPLSAIEAIRKEWKQ